MNHLDFKTINKFAKHQLVEGLLNIVFQKHQVCEACKKGKQTKASFKSSAAKSTERVLQLLHIDFFGPVFSPSYNDIKYTPIVVDDYSRFTWAIFCIRKMRHWRRYLRCGRDSTSRNSQTSSVSSRIEELNS